MALTGFRIFWFNFLLFLFLPPCFEAPSFWSVMLRNHSSFSLIQGAARRARVLVFARSHRLYRYWIVPVGKSEVLPYCTSSEKRTRLHHCFTGTGSSCLELLVKGRICRSRVARHKGRVVWDDRAINRALDWLDTTRLTRHINNN